VEHLQLPLVAAEQVLQQLVLKLQMEEQLPYHYLLQLSPLAVVVGDPKMPMVYREQMVVEADILFILEEHQLVEVSLEVMLITKEVAEAQAQEVLEFQLQEPVAELAYQVQFLEAQLFMVVVVVVEVGKQQVLQMVLGVLEEAVEEELLILP
jgi:hypothetical protein